MKKRVLGIIGIIVCSGIAQGVDLPPLPPLPELPPLVASSNTSAGELMLDAPTETAQTSELLSLPSLSPVSEQPPLALPVMPQAVADDSSAAQPQQDPLMVQSQAAQSAQPELPAQLPLSTSQQSTAGEPVAENQPAQTIPEPIMATSEPEQDVVLDQAQESLKSQILQRAHERMERIADIFKQFTSIEARADTTYNQLNKKLDLFYQENAAALGSFGSIIHDVTSYLERKDQQYGAASSQQKTYADKKLYEDITSIIAECKKKLEEGKKLVADFKEAQNLVDKDEDFARGIVVSFKRERASFVDKYGKASELKNDILIKGGNLQTLSDQIESIFKELTDRFDALKSKDMARMTEVEQKINDQIAKITSGRATLATLFDALKNSVRSIGKLEDSLTQREGRALSKSIERAKDSFSKMRSADSSDPGEAHGVTDQKLREVSSDIVNDVTKTLGDGIKVIHQSVSDALSRAAGSESEKLFDKDLLDTQLSRDALAGPEGSLASQRVQIRSLVWTILYSFWRLGGSLYSYVVSVFSQLQSDRQISASIVEQGNALVSQSADVNKPAVSGSSEQSLLTASSPLSSTTVVKDAEAPKLPDLPSLPAMAVSPSVSLENLPPLPQVVK